MNIQICVLFYIVFLEDGVNDTMPVEHKTFRIMIYHIYVRKEKEPDEVLFLCYLL